MFCIREEGGIVRNGFNFYPLTSDHFGFVLRYGKNIPLTDLGSKTFTVRYNKRTKKWVIQ